MKKRLKTPRKAKFQPIGGLKALLHKASQPHASTKSSLQGLLASILAKNDSNFKKVA